MTMRPRSTRPGNRSGFTLIEVVVVLLVLSATVALTLPAFLEPPADDDMTVANGEGASGDAARLQLFERLHPLAARQLVSASDLSRM